MPRQRVLRRWNGWQPMAVLSGLALAAFVVVTPSRAELPALTRAPLPLSLERAELEGLAWQATQGLVLGDNPLVHPALGDGLPSGIATWPAAVVPEGIDSAAVLADGSGPVEAELRTSPDGERWSSWTAAESGVPQFLAGARFYQVRAILTQDATSGAAALESVAVQLMSAPADLVAMVAAQTPAASNPTVRLWATRQGMVGGRTANGHTIVPKDRFVALPSRKALAKKDGREYQARVSANGKQATAPVWDVGPWNTKDNYWDLPADRELFKDLPRFVPQALAAWKDGYNSGRDAFGRWVTVPASIDLADGTFQDDLGLRESSWVDVTFLWLNAPSPQPLQSYPRVQTKAAPKAPQPAEPPAGQRWYFAEGSTKAPFQTWILLLNPNPEPAKATLTFMLPDGSTRSHTQELPPSSRQSVFVNQVLPDQDFSTRVDSDRPILVERAMYVRQDGHVVSGIQRPELRWCTADGTTVDGTDTWLLVQNPGPVGARTNIVFLQEGGGMIRQPQDIGPTSRLSLHTNLLVPNQRFGICVESDQPLIVERASYPRGGGANATAATPAASRTWLFAEGNQRPSVQTRLAISNQTAEAAQVDVTYLLESGEPKKRAVSVPPMGRATVDPSADVPGQRFGMVVESSRPVVAERTMSFGPAGAGSHSGTGAAAAARTWFLAEGSTGSPFQELVLLANPNDAPARVTLDLIREDGQVVPRTVTVAPRSRTTFDVNEALPDQALSVRVRSDQPIVAERSMYWGEMAGGTNAAGVPWDQPAGPLAQVP